MAVELYLLDKTGAPANLVNGRPVYGQLMGWRGLRFTPSGSALDKVAQNGFSVPLSDWRNIAIGDAVGAKVMVYDTELGDEITRGPIMGTMQVTQDDNGVFWAQVTFADEQFELSRDDVTTAFATSPNETMSTTGVRLLSLAQNPWTFVNDITGLDGVPFIATGSINQALDKLRQERFCHFRRERNGANAHIIHFALYGAPIAGGSGPILLTHPGASPTHGVEAVNVRQMFSVTIQTRLDVINRLTPIGGGGSGTNALTMRRLYGAGSFTGYDPSHPVLQRIQQAASTFDGYDYYIQDNESISQYGATSQTYPRTDINPVKNSAGGVSFLDETIAAQALYVVTLNELLRSRQPVRQLSFWTDPFHDPRNLAGLTVHIKYEGFAFDTKNNVQQFLDIDDDFTILEIVRTVDDTTGALRDQVTVSDTGQMAATTGGTILGVMDSISAIHMATIAQPMATQYPKSQNIGPGTDGLNADLSLTIPADNSVVRTHWAILFLRLEGMVHTRLDQGHVQDVVTKPTPHDVGNAGDSGDTPVHHDINSPDFEYAIGGVPQPIGESIVYNPKTSIHISSAVPPVQAKNLMYNKDSNTFYLQGGMSADEDPLLISQELSIIRIPPSTGGAGGTVKKTGDGEGLGGKTIQETHGTEDGFGAQSVEATEELVYRGPAPTGVTVLVDGVQVAGPFNANPSAIDLSAYFNNRAVAHTLTVRSPTNGAADVILDVRVDVQPLGVKPTGT